MDKTPKLPPTVINDIKPPIQVTCSKQYEVIIIDADDTRHFFLKRDDELFYDGYSVKGCSVEGRTVVVEADNTA